MQLHLVAESCTISVLATGGQSGNFWIQPRIYVCTGQLQVKHVGRILPTPGLTVVSSEYNSNLAAVE